MAYRDEKSMVLAYVIWFFVGHFGIHRMYLGRVKTGVLMLGLLVVGIALLLIIGVMVDEGPLNDVVLGVLSVSGLCLLGVWIIWYVVDVVLIAVMVSKDRRNAATYGAERMESVFK